MAGKDGAATGGNQPEAESDEAWELWYARFLAWPVGDDGRRFVPTDATTNDGFKLGLWQENQRQLQGKGLLSANRVKMLDDAGIVWSPNDERWEEGMRHFEAFEPNAAGQRIPSSSYLTPDGYRLGVWQSMQRTAYKLRRIPAHRIARLEAAGIVWDQLEATWEEGLIQFESVEPNADGKRDVPRSFITADGFKLGVWQENQRQAHKKGHMDAKRIVRLEAAGIVWEPRAEAWEEALSAFKRLKKNADGKRLIPRDFVTRKGLRLGIWQANQRELYKLGKLSEERTLQLEKAGIIWSKQKAAWEEGFAHFEAIERDGRGRRYVRTNFVTKSGFKLGAWQNGQRQAYKKGTITEERMKRLDAAGFVWTPKVSRAKGARSARSDASSSPEGTCDAEGQQRRRLQAAGALAPPPLQAEAPWREQTPLAAEEPWHAAWRQRLGCWWLALPSLTQAELGHCLGALSLHLGSRLERLLGRPPLSAAGGAAAAAEPGCEWLEVASEELQLPDFPDLGGFEFSVPPLPRLLLPPIEQLQLFGKGGGLFDVEEAVVVREARLPTRALLQLGSGAAAFALVVGVFVSRRGARPIGWKKAESAAAARSRTHGK